MCWRRWQLDADLKWLRDTYRRLRVALDEAVRLGKALGKEGTTLEAGEQVSNQVRALRLALRQLLDDVTKR